MIADYTFYKDTYKGITISNADEYEYFGERASDELALYVDRLPNTLTAQVALKKCACAIADTLYGYYKSHKDGYSGSTVSSESVNGYYSVSYGGSGSSQNELKEQIFNSIRLYLGNWIFRKIKVVF